ncbi:MAG: hypothetical protein R3A13_07125 [Bdellovibrionota bacterium]
MIESDVLLERKPSLEELVVYELAAQPALTAKFIHLAINSKGHNYSLRAVYKELTKLEESEIVYKVKKEYRLRLTWLVNLNELVDSAYQAYTSAEHLATLLRKDLGHTNLVFTDLRRLDLYWMQLMLALVKLNPNQPMFLWCPYQWFHLVHDYSVTQLYRAEDISGGKRYHIFGNDSYLAKLALKNFPKEGVYSFAESPFASEKSTYYTLMCDHLITVKLDENVTSKIAALFDSVSCEEEVNPREIVKVFSTNVKARVRVELNPSKAKKLKRKFIEYFDI